MAMFGGGRFSKELRRGQSSEGTHVIDLDASVLSPSTAAASADHVTPPVAQRQFAQALPGKVGKRKAFDLEDAEKRAKRESDRRKTPGAKAAAALRTSSAAYKAAAKERRARPKAKAAVAKRTSSAAYKALLLYTSPSPRD